MKPGCTVRITWRDAAHVGPGEWIDCAGLDPRCRVVTVGILVAKRAGHHIVAQSAQGSHHAGVFTIPDAAIVRVLQIAPVRVR